MPLKLLVKKKRFVKIAWRSKGPFSFHLNKVGVWNIPLTNWECGHNPNLVLPYFNYFLGAYGECYTSGTRIKCTAEFIGKPLTLEINIKACRRPVKIDFKLDILGLILNKEFDGGEDIPLPELSFPGLGGIFLTVNANPLESGDLALEVRS